MSIVQLVLLIYYVFTLYRYLIEDYIVNRFYTTKLSRVMDLSRDFD